MKFLYPSYCPLNMNSDLCSSRIVAEHPEMRTEFGSLERGVNSEKLVNSLKIFSVKPLISHGTIIWLNKI